MRRGLRTCGPFVVLILLLLQQLSRQCLADDAKDNVKDAKALIASMASNNKPPELKRGALRPEWSLGKNAWPVFDSDFDWENQRKVERAIASIGNTESIEAWDELLKHFESQSYCITFQINGETARNYSVGQISRAIARQRLDGIFAEEFGIDDRNRPLSITYGNKEMQNLREWRQKRQGKTFADLQIEVGESILSAIPKTEHISAERREELNREITSLINTIKKSGPQFVPFWQEYSTYDADQAKRIRISFDPNR